jgi:glycine/D-amino acid oxidase-like deaminating enzyme
MHGVKILEGVGVADITEKVFNGHRRVTGVVTTAGDVIEAEYVVNCAGMWARQLGEQNRVTIPNQAAEHYYIVTDAMPEVDPSWPVVEDPSSYTYIRPEAGGLMVGLFEPEAAAWNVGQIPKSFAFGEIEPDWERMTPFVEKAMSRVPATLNAGTRCNITLRVACEYDVAPVVINSDSSAPLGNMHS